MQDLACQRESLTPLLDKIEISMSGTRKNALKEEDWMLIAYYEKMRFKATQDIVWVQLKDVRAASAEKYELLREVEEQLIFLSEELNGLFTLLNNRPVADAMPKFISKLNLVQIVAEAAYSKTVQALVPSSQWREYSYSGKLSWKATCYKMMELDESILCEDITRLKTIVERMTLPCERPRFKSF